MKEPKCPSCEIIGTEHITYKINIKNTSNTSKKFNIAYCTECGHIYNIFPIDVLSEIKNIAPILHQKAGPKHTE